MKPFTFSILCCKKCNLNTKFRLFIDRNSKIEVDTDIDFLREHLDMFTFNDKQLLKDLIDSFKNVENSYNLNLSEIENIDENIEKIYLFLLANDIEQGKIVCEECNKEHNIEDGIVDFLD